MSKIKHRPKPRTKEELDKVFPGYGQLQSLGRLVVSTKEENSPEEDEANKEVMSDEEFNKTLDVFNDIKWDEAGVNVGSLSMTELINIIRNTSRQVFREFMVDGDPSVLTTPDSVPLELPPADDDTDSLIDKDKDIQKLNSSVRERKRTVCKKKQTTEADSYTTGRMKRTLNKLEDDVREAERLLKKRIKQEKDAQDKRFDDQEKKKQKRNKNNKELNEQTYNRLKVLAGIS